VTTTPYVKSSERVADAYDGRSAKEIAATLALPRVVLFEEIGSTLDVAHRLGEEGAAAGTLVLADAQTAGRGRMGRSWQSEPGAGIWLTLLERPSGDDALTVLALRLALALGPALDAFAATPIRLKWPNDLFVGNEKLAGVLVEARWHGSRLDWLALGVGINVLPPQMGGAAGLLPRTERHAVLAAVVPALRSAIQESGQLAREELELYAARDLARGRTCSAPGQGVVAGIRADGALLVDGTAGRLAFHTGSLVLAAANSLG